MKKCNLVFLSAWFTSAFWFQIKVKLNKRRENMCDLQDLSITNFLDKKVREIKDNPGYVFKRLKEVLDELARYEIPLVP